MFSLRAGLLVGNSSNKLVASNATSVINGLANQSVCPTEPLASFAGTKMHLFPSRRMMLAAATRTQID